MYSIPAIACCMLPERAVPPPRIVEFCVGVGSADDSLGGDEKLLAGLSIAGLVPDRLRGSPWLGGTDSGWGFVRNCAAEADGRKRRRGATEPIVPIDDSAEISSVSFGGGAGGGDVDSLWEGLSVDAVVALPLRCRSLYFSIASASRSRIRVAIGDNADAGLELPVGKRVAEPGCETGDVAKPNVLLVELADGCPGEWDPEGSGAGRLDGDDQNLVEDCCGG